MALARSKSAPHVAGPPFHPASRLFQASSLDGPRPPKIRRHASALAVASFAAAAASSSSLRSGQQTPRVDRQDDPFSLAGFFPASLSSVYETPAQMEWDWLHYEVDESELVGNVPPSMASGYASPTSSEEGEEWALPATPPSGVPMFDRSEDEVCGETIRREDKLGVLSLPNPFTSISKDSEVGASIHPPPTLLLSPYNEDDSDPLDSDALYNALCALRKAHAVSETASVVSRTSGSSGTLFSSVEEEGGVVDSDLETLGTWGLGRLLDMLPL
ncbi:hypothetical protein EIP91_005530 [Steccherinum ochraceum]|uniref:Uncharacterized protein n=1 Tax=Steccherinum ochraceum TaxID=92696 RepID=A0A4R0RMU1_9APHY|nr:hypothetical protein EIP91_005530 [Steccherinum ochraceum]